MFCGIVSFEIPPVLEMTLFTAFDVPEKLANVSVMSLLMLANVTFVLMGLSGSERKSNSSETSVIRVSIFKSDSGS